MLFSVFYTTAALFVARAAAHGAVTSYIIDGVTYPGYAFNRLAVLRIVTDIYLVTLAILQPPLQRLSSVSGPTTTPLLQSPTGR